MIVFNLHVMSLQSYYNLNIGRNIFNIQLNSSEKKILINMREKSLLNEPLLIFYSYGFPK